MPNGLVNNALARAAKRVPGLKRLPIMKLLAAGEVVVLARDHYDRLEPHERRRIVELLRTGRGRPSNLSQDDQDELAELVAKAEPRLFLGEAADKLSPVPLPRRLIRGPKTPRP
jgi:hypothetical protein